jgi:2-polyprenyl-6-methoxyphenol hydroxylase-like FAD-dependent oxidoreductase
MVKAMVIGAGIGGLAAGIALQQAGFDVDVFERSEKPKEGGAGISLWANAIHALARLGISDTLRSASSPYAIGGLRTWNGTTLASIPMTELERKVSVPIIVLHRADLLAILLDACGVQRVHLGCQCVGFRQDAAGATAQFADGSHASADLLIGADGLNSVIRSALHGDQRPRYTGCTAWRAVAPFDIQAVRATESWGFGRVFGQVPMSGSRVYWYATKNGPEGEHSTCEKDDLLRLFRGWHAPIEQLIEATPQSAILRNDIYDRPVLRSWGKGRVTLLGDAAHPMTPYLGQGGCQALEDAVVLAKCLSANETIESALHAYESERTPRTNALVKRSRLIGRIAQLEHPIVVNLRNTAFKLVSPSLQASQLARIVSHEV